MLTSSSAQSTNVLEVRALVTPEESIALAQEAYAAGRIDARELERRIGEALGVR